MLSGCDISTDRSRTVTAGGCALLRHAALLRPRECRAGLEQETLEKRFGEVYAERGLVYRRAFGKAE